MLASFVEVSYVVSNPFICKKKKKILFDTVQNKYTQICLLYGWVVVSLTYSPFPLSILLVNNCSLKRVVVPFVSLVIFLTIDFDSLYKED